MNLVTTTGKAGLYCETASGAYWVWAHANGTVTREVNGVEITGESFPASARLANQMDKLFQALQPDLARLIALDANTDEYKSLWWMLKDAVC